MRSKFKWIFALLLAFSVQVTFAQEKTVTGTVKDNEGFPLPGVTVTVAGTNKGANTDIDGKYSIVAAQGQSLVFTYVSMATQTITVGASSTIDVKLVPAQTDLEIVTINTGYKSTTQRKNPTAVSTISIDAIEERANASVIQNLQGQVSGLNISTGSGQPGADSTIILRGVGTINGNVEPLFVVDGVPVDEDGFRSINQNDISTITVLKDAAATSIYGNRGGNGVIVITTKKAKYGDKMTLKYSSQFGVTELQGLNIELMNSRQMLKLEQQYGGGVGGNLSDAEIDAIANQTNTYWTDYLFRKGTTQSHDLSISTGSENSSNFTSLGYFEQEGIFINTNFKRFSARNNFTGKSADNTFNISANFSRSNGIDGAGSNAIFFAPFSAALRGLPYLSPFDADGSVTSDGGIAPGDDNAVTADKIPYVLLNSAKMNTDVEDEFKLYTSLSASYNFAKNLTASVQLGVDYSDYTTLEILHPNSILGPFQITGQSNTNFGGTQSEASTRDFRFNNTTSLNYNNTFGKHTIDVTAYVEYNKAHYSGINFTARGLDPRIVGTGAAFVNVNTIELGQEIYTPSIGSFKVQEGLFSYFGNLQYDYDSKYVFNASVRRDASFRFVDDNKWGTFWSLGGAWNIDQEAFLKDKTALNMLKLRASYGTSGNQRIQNAQYSALNLTRSLYSQGAGYNSNPSTFASQLGNVDLQWEDLAQANIGIDFGLWKNKLSGNVDVYRKVTTDLFQKRPISWVNGTSEIDANIGAMENKGIEATLKYVVYDKNDWNISVNGNFSYNKNKIRELPKSYEGIADDGSSAPLMEGEAIGSFYVIRYAGVNPANGNALFLNADGDLTEQLSQADRVKTGKSVYPVWQGGFGTNIGYKGFEFTTQWSWLADVYRNNLDMGTVEETSTISDGGNRSTSVLTAWQNPGDITTVPRVGNPFNSIDYINSTDRYLEDASFLRLRNVSLGYTFNKDLLKKTPFTALKFFIQGENLLTFSSYRGWDAEAGFRTTDRGNYPTPKIFTLGATINF
ncbi:SusC/RagA family TonB-linked outer membrane protein [Flavobacterium pallidum]|uniref:SusC/RagA family TonB-linked outer membrane protein n=1 Tax=Flavobacterium pallidum TaxID=2172098 RepID=A0A2S1SDT9_9FLAO|nr:TonB-dependent receptor [Flavobacterium pallidum]AWI24532.1 SusC/RagA family TonB-linked outer membrane protein [Flavobacterium pallidum]